MKKRFFLLPSVLALSSLFSPYACAQSMPPAELAGKPEAAFSARTSAPIAADFTLKEAAQAAVLKNPEVLARWHAYREAEAEVGVARGGFLPKVDVYAASGRQKTEQKDTATDLSYSGNERGVSLRQMLFDGMATYSEVKRLGRAKLVRYFELLDASENAALEAGRAYLDVVRYRKHVALAEDNYIQHQAAYEQLKHRAQTGVGKRVDVDQAASRLALADVNLTTAHANLHDVTARYLRIVGEPPAGEMAAPDGWGKDVPANAEAALAAALARNPALRASIENVEAAQYDLQGRRSAFMPRFDLIARSDKYSNYEDAGTRDDSRVEVRMNYNLFNGGSDLARSRQYRERKDLALDQREKACRDMRQTLSIAYNDTLRLNDQLTYISRQVELVGKTRTAYRDQFNIGQRTLLDLLNTQNEYFDARRSQVNAEIDLALAYLRSYAGMGQLLETLGLKRLEGESVPDADLTPIDAAQLCPAVAPAEGVFDREALARKAKEIVAGTNGFVGGRPVVGEGAPAPVSEAKGKTELAGTETEVTTRARRWAAAWAAKDVKAYLDFYAPDFTPEAGQTREAWARQREQRIALANSIKVEIQNPVVRLTDLATAVMDFRQSYRADHLSDVTEKTIEWRKEGGQWLIVRESVRHVGGAM